MNSKYMWRRVAFIVAALNLLLWLWSHDGLRWVGLGPKSVQEPYRLENQVNPELLTLKPAASEPR